MGNNSTQGWAVLVLIVAFTLLEHFTVLRGQHRVPPAGCRDDGGVDRDVPQSQGVGKRERAGNAVVDRAISEEDADMTFVGLAVTFLGFVIAFVSLGVTDSTGVRMGMVLAGIVVSLSASWA